MDTEEYRIEVIELDSNKFITTLWKKAECYEFDRQVFEFETSGGAFSCAFDILKDLVYWNNMKESQMKIINEKLGVK